MSTSRDTYQVLVVEDDADFLHGLRINLEAMGCTVHTCVFGAEAVDMAVKTRPDLIIVDLQLPDIPGHEVIERIRAEGIETPVLVLSATGDKGDVIRALRARVVDYVDKVEGPTKILERVHHALARPESFGANRLTQREEDVYALVVNGLSNKAISRELGIEVSTVKVHVHAILRKLDVRMRSDLRRPRRG